jgi:hypothetical protein
MRGRRIALGVLTAAGLLAWAGATRAGDDTVRLNLTGDTPTLNLVDDGTEADTIAVARGGGGRGGGGGFRAGGGGFRAGGFRAGGFRAGGFRAGGFRAGGFRTAGFRAGGFNRFGFNRGFNRFAFNRGFNRFGFNRFGFNRFGFNRGFGGWGGGWGWPWWGWGGGWGWPWWNNWGWGGWGSPGWGWGGSPWYNTGFGYSDYYDPSYYSAYPYYGSSLGGGTVILSITPSSTYMPPADAAVPMMPPADTTYPYDGGPQVPVPMPQVLPSPTQVPPKPAPAPADGRVVSLPKKQAGKWAYPAYGEPAKRTSFAEDQTLLTRAKK